MCRLGFDASGQCVRSRSTVVVVVAARSLLVAVDTIVVRFSCTTHRLQLTEVDCIVRIRTSRYVGNLVAAVIQTAGGEAYGVTAACCRSDGHTTAVGNGLVTGRISGGNTGECRRFFHADSNSGFTSACILSNVGF